MIQTIIEAEALVIGSPTYKGSYTGLFKHVFDLLDPADLRGKPVILTATGGGDRHSLVVEHQLRPLFAFSRLLCCRRQSTPRAAISLMAFRQRLFSAA